MCPGDVCLLHPLDYKVLDVNSQIVETFALTQRVFQRLKHRLG